VEKGKQIKLCCGLGSLLTWKTTNSSQLENSKEPLQNLLLKRRKDCCFIIYAMPTKIYLFADQSDGSETDKDCQTDMKLVGFGCATSRFGAHTRSW
jgi:hypothetical protein